MLALLRGLVALAAVALASTAGAAHAADWSCGAPPAASGATKAVFGHAATKADASAIARRVLRRGLRFVEVEHVGCGDWQVVISGFNTPRMQREFVREAIDSGFPGVSFQTTADLTKESPPGTVKAVFGSYRTIAPANRMLIRAAGAGFRQIGIARYGLHSFKVVVVGVPLAASQEFAKQARSVGLRITYELG